MSISDFLRGSGAAVGNERVGLVRIKTQKSVPFLESQSPRGWSHPISDGTTRISIATRTEPPHLRPMARNNYLRLKTDYPHHVDFMLYSMQLQYCIVCPQ